jgi:methyltransferase (TIGR00027 family)
VFEIDHPITQKAKLERLRKVIDPFPDYVTFIQVDFNTQTLGERLLASGYNERDKTLFIWQGVTMYLTPEGVDSTLTFVVHHSGPVSAVIFDYFYNETLRNMKVTWWITRVIGERLIFGIDQNQVETFLTRRGFSDICNMTSEDLKRLYFTGPNAGRPISTGVAIVSARANKNNN